MPDHVTNQIMVKNDDADHTKLLELAIFLKPDKGKLGDIDFNKLLPMPEELNIEACSIGENGLKLYSQFMKESLSLAFSNLGRQRSKEEQNRLVSELIDKYAKIAERDPEEWELGEKYYNNLQKYGARHWYDWTNKHWGTKWNAYDCIPWEKGSDMLEFYTAWDSVVKLMAMLSKKFPEMEITYRWANEDLGYDVGEIVMKDGRIEQERLPIGGSKEAYEMAAEIMGSSPEEWGFVFSEAEGTYVYTEDIEQRHIEKLHEERSEKKEKKTRNDTMER